MKKKIQQNRALEREREQENGENRYREPNFLNIKRAESTFGTRRYQKDEKVEKTNRETREIRRMEKTGEYNHKKP